MSEQTLPASAPPNSLSPDRLRLRPAADGGLVIDPERAGWRYLSFRTMRLRFGQTFLGPLQGQEVAIVTLVGGCEVTAPAARAMRLEGRPSVFDGAPWACYLPADRPFAIRALGEEALLALAAAPSSGRASASGEPILIRPDDVAVEIRGAGNATRQINHIIAPDFPADRLEVVEVFTPSGNWSSWPPHKHDTDAMPGEAVLEEVYCYQFRRPEAWGIQRLYRRPGSAAGPPRDAAWAVGHGDVVLVTDGYHPFVATHGDDAYYLNALAGDRRTMACSYDPDLDWVRASWSELAPDPRLPLVR